MLSCFQAKLCYEPLGMVLVLLLDVQPLALKGFSDQLSIQLTDKVSMVNGGAIVLTGWPHIHSILFCPVNAGCSDLYAPHHLQEFAFPRSRINPNLGAAHP